MSSAGWLSGSWQKCGEDVSREEAECSNDIVWALQPPPATSWSLTPDLWCTAAWPAVQCTVYSVQCTVAAAGRLAAGAASRHPPRAASSSRPPAADLSQPQPQQCLVRSRPERSSEHTSDQVPGQAAVTSSDQRRVRARHTRDGRGPWPAPPPSHQPPPAPCQVGVSDAASTTPPPYLHPADAPQPPPTSTPPHSTHPPHCTDTSAHSSP